jgi:hypothetical protein
MGSHVYWLFFFVLLYWGYCITIGVTGYLGQIGVRSLKLRCAD